MRSHHSASKDAPRSSDRGDGDFTLIGPRGGGLAPWGGCWWLRLLRFAAMTCWGGRVRGGGLRAFFEPAGAKRTADVLGEGNMHSPSRGRELFTDDLPGRESLCSSECGEQPASRGTNVPTAEQGSLSVSRGVHLWTATLTLSRSWRPLRLSKDEVPKS